MRNSNRNLERCVNVGVTSDNRGLLYRVWLEMHSRCNNPDNKRYVQYGGRGIRVCVRWDSFEAFLADMGPRPEGTGIGGQSLYSLDRIDNDGDYEPNNCRWATASQQQRNTTRNRLITSTDGITLVLFAWAERLGVSVRAIQLRMSRDGMTEEEAVSKPFRTYRRSRS